MINFRNIVTPTGFWETQGKKEKLLNISCLLIFNPRWLCFTSTFRIDQVTWTIIELESLFFIVMAELCSNLSDKNNLI